MVDPLTATLIIIGFIVIFGLILPIANRKLPKYVSYRWCVVVVVLAILIGVVVDFSALPDDIRGYIIIGSLIITGGYIVLRTIEKALANGWLHGAQIEVRKGDIEAKISGSEKGGKYGP